MQNTVVCWLEPKDQLYRSWDPKRLNDCFTPSVYLYIQYFDLHINAKFYHFIPTCKILYVAMRVNVFRLIYALYTWLYFARLRQLHYIRFHRLPSSLGVFIENVHSKPLSLAAGPQTEIWTVGSVNSISVDSFMKFPCNVTYKNKRQWIWDDEDVWFKAQGLDSYKTYRVRRLVNLPRRRVNGDNRNCKKPQRRQSGAWNFMFVKVQPFVDMYGYFKADS